EAASRRIGHTPRPSRYRSDEQREASRSRRGARHLKRIDNWLEPKFLEKRSQTRNGSMQPTVMANSGLDRHVESWLRRIELPRMNVECGGRSALLGGAERRANERKREEAKICAGARWP